VSEREVILAISGLQTEFKSRGGSVRAVRDLNFNIAAGQTLALVGESGSGKSVTSLAIMGLLPQAGYIAAGSVLYKNRRGEQLDLVNQSAAQMREIRGAEIAMIFQEPMTSLNPLFSIGDQIGEMLLLHTDLDATARAAKVIEMLELVEIPAAASRYHDYPHELSGGMRQRVMIAMAMILKPALLIADEPTTALDVTIQAQILDLMRRLQKELNMAILFITHDMGVVAEMADEVAVMYAGEIVEQAPVQQLFMRPSHPYTQGLLKSIPGAGGITRSEDGRLQAIPGSIPMLNAMPKGCSFGPRCAGFVSGCQDSVELAMTEPLHWVRCSEIGVNAHA